MICIGFVKNVCARDGVILKYNILVVELISLDPMPTIISLRPALSSSSLRSMPLAGSCMPDAQSALSQLSVDYCCLQFSYFPLNSVGVLHGAQVQPQRFCF